MILKILSKEELWELKILQILQILQVYPKLQNLIIKQNSLEKVHK